MFHLIIVHVSLQTSVLAVRQRNQKAFITGLGAERILCCHEALESNSCYLPKVGKGVRHDPNHADSTKESLEKFYVVLESET